MSDDECAFDNWQQAAQELEKQQLEQKPEQTQTQSQSQANQISDALNQQQKAQKAPLDPKQALKKKIQLYQDMTLEDFEATEDQISENNKISGKKIGNPVLKSDKDFNNYARTLAKRFDSMVQSEDATIDDEKLSLFFEELTLYMYKNLQWKNLHEVQAKVRVLKKQRKADEEKRRKQKEKQERAKKLQGQGSEQQSQSQTLNKKQQKPQDDLFGGAAIINSKQEEEERKNKIIVQEEKKQEKKEESDDDDFM